jgi:hypothetical protein
MSEVKLKVLEVMLVFRWLEVVSRRVSVDAKVSLKLEVDSVKLAKLLVLVLHLRCSHMAYRPDLEVVHSPWHPRRHLTQLAVDRYIK